MKHENPIPRREMLKRAGLAGAAVLAAPMISRGRFRLFANSVTEYSSKAVDLVGRTTVIDMLSVLTLDFPKQTKWFKDPEAFTAADLQPYTDSGINVFHPAIGMGGPNSYDNALQFFASWNGSRRSGFSHKRHKRKKGKENEESITGSVICAFVYGASCVCTGAGSGL